MGASDAVPEAGRLVVDAGSTSIGVFRVQGRLYAYENVCPHQGGPVCQGLLIPAVREVLSDAGATTGFDFDEQDRRIVCPWHGYEFRIETGCHPARTEVRLRAVEVEEKGGAIYVAI